MPSEREFREIYELMRHKKWLFVKRAVGLMLKREVPPKPGYVLQTLRLGSEEMFFIYSDLGKFRPLIWTKEKLDAKLEEMFSFVPDNAIVKDESILKSLARFNQGLVVTYGSYPEWKPLPEGREGVEFRKGDRVSSSVVGEGKAIPKWETMTIFHPLCPLPLIAM